MVFSQNLVQQNMVSKEHLKRSRMAQNFAVKFLPVRSKKIAKNDLDFGQNGLL